MQNYSAKISIFWPPLLPLPNVKCTVHLVHQLGSVNTFYSTKKPFKTNKQNFRIRQLFPSVNTLAKAEYLHMLNMQQSNGGAFVAAITYLNANGLHYDVHYSALLFMSSRRISLSSHILYFKSKQTHGKKVASIHGLLTPKQQLLQDLHFTYMVSKGESLELAN